MSKALVIIPTYNEKENIEAIVRVALSQRSNIHVLVVDDGSPDGTGDIVKSLQSNGLMNRLHLIERSGKLGLGRAYIAGFKYALERDYDYIIEMDADFSHPPQMLGPMIDCCNQDADICVGSRYVKGGGVLNWPFKRLALSRGASFYVQLITRMPIKDPTAGFVCYRRKVLDTLDLDKIEYVGYAFQIELKFLAHRLGFRIKELPIIFKDRVLGKSKMNMSIIHEAITGVVKLALKNPKDYTKNTKMSSDHVQLKICDSKLSSVELMN